MKKKTKWPVIAGVAFIIIFITAMVYSSTGNNQYRAEICVTFEGRTVCRNAAATTREEAERIGTSTACTDLTNGMTALLQCEQGAARKVTWKR
jgi:hypothetical protein